MGLINGLFCYANKTESKLIKPIKTIKLNTSNTIIIKGEINSKSANAFLYKLNLIENKKKLYLYIDTNGGSVEDGYKIINEVIKYNVSCIAEKAYSMGFAILQSCKRRYIVPFGKIMQHQISFGISNEKAKVESYITYINQMEEMLLSIQSVKIGISALELKERTYNEWWMFGENAVIQNCADKIVQVECSPELTRANFTVVGKYYDYVYSKCPLISDYIDKKENKDSKNIFDLFGF
jgi:ATP-dependent protease ClpP protease subunit